MPLHRDQQPASGAPAAQDDPAGPPAGSAPTAEAAQDPACTARRGGCTDACRCGQPGPGAVEAAVAVLLQASPASERRARQRAALLRVIPDAALALRIEGEPDRPGEAQPETAALAAWLDSRPVAGLLALNRLPATAPVGGRLLAIALPRTPSDWIIWLRPATAPRWRRAEIAAAAALRTAWLEASLHNAESQAAARAAAAAHQSFLMAELDHRLKNILANIQALLRHSRRRAAGPAIDADAFVEDFEARLHAMATAHDLLHASRWEGARLRPLVAEELRPHADATGGGRIAMSGRDLVLRPRAAMSLSLALHELATNAVKHGALSRPEGRVALRWRCGRAGLVLHWAEHDGPPAAAPTRRGFGLTVIERSLAYELGGSGRLVFAPEGLRCTIRIPAEHILSPT